MFNRTQELAVPKGIVVPTCEICGNKATTKCKECRVTHYCSENHKLTDSKAFHHRVCKILCEMRMERPVPFSEVERTEERNTLLQKKKALYKLAESSARKWLLMKDFELAYAPALIAQNMARDLWSPDNIEFIYPTCLVAEMFLGSRDLKIATEYMTIASWISQKYDTIPAVVLSQLYRLKGLVYMTIKKWKEARRAFAELVYATAVEHGRTDIRMGIAYGYLGLALLECSNVDGAMTSFHKMADKWMEWLLTQYENKTMRVATDLEMNADKNVEEIEFQFMESKVVFQWLYEKIRHLGMDAVTDLINFKILCIQALSQMRANNAKDSIVFKEEALSTATRTKMDKAVKKCRLKLLVEVLGDDFLIRWERKHNRPRTVATKYLEMIKGINV